MGSYDASWPNDESYFLYVFRPFLV